MIAEGLSYKQAVDLIEVLKTQGIEANITVGGIRLNPKISDIDYCKKICIDAGAAVSDGNITILQVMTANTNNILT